MKRAEQIYERKHSNCGSLPDIVPSTREDIVPSTRYKGGHCPQHQGGQVSGCLVVTGTREDIVPSTREDFVSCTRKDRLVGA